MERETMIALVTAVQNGDQDAAGALYDASYQDIYYHILKNVDHDQELAADLTQDTFIEILQTIDKLEEPAAFISWSHKIAYHKCTAYFRKSRELLVDEYGEDDFSIFDTVVEEREEFIPGEALDKEDLKKTLTAMINDLPEEQRSALLLRYFGEISVKEIAQVQGVTEGTVKSRLNYARKALKKAVEDYEKKNDIRLHSIGVAPVFAWLFKEYAAAGKLSAAADAAAVLSAWETASAANTAGAAGGSIFKRLVSFFKEAVTKEVAVGVTTAAVVVGGVALAAAPAAPQPTNILESGPDFSQHIPDNVACIVFTDIEVPEGAEVIDVSEAKDGSVLAWVEETDKYDDRDFIQGTAYIMYVTTVNGETLYANWDCSTMFSVDATISTDLSIYEGVLVEVVFDNFDTSNVKRMTSMFDNCPYLEYLDLTGFDTSNATEMGGMFHWCVNLRVVDLSSFDVSNAEQLSGMFFECGKLETIYAGNWSEICVLEDNVNGNMPQQLFSNNYALVGAVAYLDTVPHNLQDFDHERDPRLGISMANPETGYFTEKPAE